MGGGFLEALVEFFMSLRNVYERALPLHSFGSILSIDPICLVLRAGRLTSVFFHSNFPVNFLY